MSRFPAELLRLARAVAAVRGLAPQLTTADGASIALQARSAALSLVSRMVVGLGAQPTVAINTDRVGGARDIDQGEAGRLHWTTAMAMLSRVPDAPVASLALLAHVEAGLGTGNSSRPTDLLSVVTGSDYEEGWRRVLGAAITASEAWDGLAPDLTASAQWTVAADAASIAAALSNLDRDLLPAIAAADPTRQADISASLSATHLRSAALQVLDVASAGPLPSLDAFAWQARRGPVSVHSPFTLIEAQARLPQLLRDSPHLAPGDIVAVAAAQALAHRLAADSAAPGVDATHARNVAQALTTCTSAQTMRQLRTLPVPDESDHPVRQQATEMTRYLLTAASSPGAVPQRFSQAMLDLAPAVIAESANAARRELRQGHWLITYGPVPSLFAQSFPAAQAAEHHLELPRLLTQLREAAAAAGPDPQRVLPPPSRLQQTPQPFTVLHSVAREQRTARPERVADVDDTSLPLGEEHRDWLINIRARLRRTADERRQQPPGIRSELSPHQGLDIGPAE